MSHQEIFAEIDKRKIEFIERLRDAVKIPSVSSDPARRPDVMRMMNWAENELKTLGATCEQVDIGYQKLPNGTQLPLPPVLFATLGNDKTKKTVLIYAHLDVQPAAKSDGWDTDPFELVEKNGALYGRGSTDDKGPAIAWFNAISVLQQLKVDIPVNLKFVLEGMEESGSEGLDDCLKERKDTFLSDVEATCISDNYWLGKKKPCITYGLRGSCYYFVEVTSQKQDLHSGVFGGVIHEPMVSLVKLLSTLTDVDGRIKIDGLDKLVAPLTEEEKATYKNIDFDLNEFQSDLGVSTLVSDSPTQILMNRWRYPSLSVHGIEGAFADPGTKTVIPNKVIGKFSIRIVPNMLPEDVHPLVTTYLDKQWAELKTPCKLKVTAAKSGRPWLSSYDHVHYQAAARALKRIHNCEPDYIREGGSIPVTLTFQELTGKNVLLLPIGASDDSAHSQNEKINVSNYIDGTKILAAYLLELSSL